MLRRAAVAALAMILLTTGAVLADFVPADADHVNGGPQGTFDLGQAEPGETLTPNIAFELVCSGIRHADPGQIVLLEPGMTVVPDPSIGGSISATPATIGPVPGDWTNDTLGASSCPLPAPRLAANGPSLVTIVAPLVPGDDYEFTIFFNKFLTPMGVNDASSVAGLTVATFRLDVVDADTTPPVLHDVPAGIELVTADPAGATLAYAPPTATDDRDPNPVVTCAPLPGDVAPVGASEVTCTATDATGNSASASFPVTVHLASVLWEEPVGNGGTFAIRGGRSVPIKVQAWLGGVPVVEGSPMIVVTTCGGDPVAASASMEYQPTAGRWMGHLDTETLGPGCYRVSLTAGAISFGSFQLDVGSTTATKARGQKPH